MADETRLSLDLQLGDEILVGGPARVMVAKRAGRRVRVVVKAERDIPITRVVNDE